MTIYELNNSLHSLGENSSLHDLTIITERQDCEKDEEDYTVIVLKGVCKKVLATFEVDLIGECIYNLKIEGSGCEVITFAHVLQLAFKDYL